jgi:hypothetical protein
MEVGMDLQLVLEEEFQQVWAGKELRINLMGEI